MQSAISRLADNIQKKPFTYISLLIVSTIISFIFIIGLNIDGKQVLPGLKVDNSFELWFREDDPGRLQYDLLKDYFGSDEYIIVAFKTDNVLKPKTLHKIEHLTHRFNQLPDIQEVTSITNIDDFRGINDTLYIEELFEEIPESQETVDSDRPRILGNPLFNGGVISSDGNTAALILRLTTTPQENNYQRVLTDRIYNICEEESENGDYKFHVSGNAILIGEEDKGSTVDSRTEKLLMLGFIILFLYTIFRRAVMVFAPLLVIILANIWTHALFPVFNSSVNMVTSIIVTLVMVIGIADAIHMISEYNSQVRQGKSGKVSARQAFIVVAIPCLFTSITTAAGFLSMSISQLTPISDFGFFAAISMMLTLAINMILMLLILGRIKVIASTNIQEINLQIETKNSIISKLMEWIVATNKKYVKTNIVIALLIAAFSITGIYQIKVNTNEVEYFDTNHPYPVSVRFIEENLTGTMTIEVLLTGDNNHFKNPEVLSKIEKLQHYMDSYDEILKTISIVDYMKEINQVMHNGNPDFYTIPATRELISQYTLLSDDSFDDYLDTISMGAARIHGRLINLDSNRMAEIISELQAKTNEIFHGSTSTDTSALQDTTTATLTGTMKLYTNAVDYIIESQIKGFGLALIMVYVLMSLLVRSFKLGLLAMVPNVIPIFLTFGIMGWAGINLDFGTVIIASVALGLAVDDTIHFISRFKNFYSKTGDYDTAVSETIRHVGPPITTTTIALFFGFIVLLVSTFKPLAFFGLLVAVTMVSAWAADLFVLPALIKTFKPLGQARSTTDESQSATDMTFAEPDSST